MATAHSPRSILSESILSTTDLRNVQSIFEQLRQRPLDVKILRKYDQDEAVMISPVLWKLLQGALEGTVRELRIPILFNEQPTGRYKQVLFEELPLEPYDDERTWRVWVDSRAYNLSALRGNTSRFLEPDWNQELWSHHPNVALAVLKACPWSDEHQAQQEQFNREEQQSYDASGDPEQFMRDIVEEMDITQHEIRFDDPNQVEKAHASLVFQDLEAVRRSLEVYGEDYFESNVERIQGSPLGKLNHNLDELAASLLITIKGDELRQKGWDFSEMASEYGIESDF